MRNVVVACLVIAASCGSFRIARAQSRPEDVQAAAAAFGEGQRAQLRGEYARAADLFELADRSAPNPAALRSAIRNHRAAGQLARAATLARIARERYAGDAETGALADEVIAEAAPRLAEVRVSCAPACSLAIEGHVAGESARESFDLFVEPGSRTLVASWSGRDPVTRVIDMSAGSRHEIALEPPAMVAERGPEAEPAPIDEVIARPAPPASDGISPWFFGIATGLSAIVLGIAIGSGLDTLEARDRYVMNPTRAGYEDGVARQWRTTGLFIGAGVCAATAAVLAILTDWGAESASTDSSTALVPWIAIDPGGASAGIGGAL